MVSVVDAVLLGFRLVEDGDSPTFAKFVIVLPAEPFTVAAICSIAIVPALMLPIVQVPVEDAYEPMLVVAFKKLRPDGKVSVATTPVDVAGPSAEIFIV
jgi:hypothetical protein